MQHVYKIVKDGKLIDFGKTNNIERRANERKAEGILEVLSSYNTKREALLEEGRLKEEHGMEWTEWTGRTSCRHTTFEIAEQIRKEYIPKKVTNVMLAKKYNLSENTVKRITRGQTYIRP